ncbi:MAG: DUF934 domain-containing protein [Hahellaceae bacterium]|nr:DUF934 domain-containing protein [Hahellaceae bacterium]
MAKLIKDKAIIENSWTTLAADFEGELPAGSVIVPLTYWQNNREALVARGNVAVWLDSDQAPEELQGDLDSLVMIAINFPKFADGRGYSYARLLRERFHFKGELRAIGDVLQDQLFYMSRVGFNAFEVRADRSPEEALEGLNDFSDVYQAACDQPTPLFIRRAG